MIPFKTHIITSTYSYNHIGQFGVKELLKNGGLCLNHEQALPTD